MGRKVVVLRRDDSRDTWLRILKISGWVLAGAAAVGGLGFLFARERISRHQRDLFSPHPLQRLAALESLRSRPGVDNVLLLRDYVAWEERPFLRRRAASILGSMERELAELAEEEGAEGL